MVVNIPTATWMKQVKEKEAGVPNIQFINIYEGENHPFENDLPSFLDFSWHPQPSRLNLRFSHGGTWVVAPKERGDKTGPYYKNHHIARIKTYINYAGEIKKAVAYGKDTGAMKIWYDYEELKNDLETWIFPEVPYFYNNKKWNNKMRKEHEKLENELNMEREDSRKGQSQKSRGYESRKGDSENYYHRDRRNHSQNPRHYSDWEDDSSDIPHSEVGRSSGVGRASNLTRRERESNPGQGHRRRSKSRDRDSRYKDGRYSDRSQSRERRRDNGAERARKYHYGGSGRS